MAQEGCIKVGAVSFLNTKPLIQPILDNRISNIDLMLDVPSQIADELRVGTLDVGLIPIIEYFRFSDYRILPEISISSRGAVKSIRIFSRKPISECQTIALDTNSRTSRVLTQIILAEKYDIYPSFLDCPPTVNLESVEPEEVGGGMVDKVFPDNYFVSKKFPDREEAGTPNILGAITLGAAIHVLDSIGMDIILNKDLEITDYVFHQSPDKDIVYATITTKPNVNHPYLVFAHVQDSVMYLVNPFGKEIKAGTLLRIPSSADKFVNLIQTKISK